MNSSSLTVEVIKFLGKVVPEESDVRDLRSAIAAASIVRVAVEALVKALYIDFTRRGCSLRTKIDTFRRKKISFKYALARLREYVRDSSLVDAAGAVWYEATRLTHFSEVLADALEGEEEKYVVKAKQLVSGLKRLIERVESEALDKT